MSERDLFLAARDIADAAERVRYLDAACGGDAELRRRIEELLAADVAAEKFLESPPAPVTTDDPSRSTDDDGPAVGTVVAGRYKLLQRIGEGGMGVVYMAEQQE